MIKNLTVIPEYSLPIPDVLYKFIHSSDIHHVTNSGTFRICSNEFYRARYYEMEVKNPFINDPEEGFEAAVQNTSFNLGNATENEMAHLRSLIPGVQGTGGDFSNNAIQYVLPPFHMLCFTLGHPDQTASVFTRKYGDMPPYDACLKFSRIPELFDKICLEGLLFADKEKPGDPFLGIFDRIGLMPVNYIKKVRSWKDNPVEISEFNKDITFSEQQEYRFVFMSQRYNGRIYHDLICKVPDLGDFVEVISLEG